MIDTGFEKRIETAMRERVQAVRPRSRLTEFGAPPIASMRGPSPLRRRLPVLAAAAVVLLIIGGLAALSASRQGSGQVETISPAHSPEVGDAPTPPVATDFVVDIVIWLYPEIASDDIESARRRLAERKDVEEFGYFNQDETFAEFSELFADAPEIVEVMTADKLPSSFRLSLTDGTSRGRTEELVDEFEGWPGVRSVVTGYDPRTDNGFTAPFGPANAPTTTTVPAVLFEPVPWTQTNTGLPAQWLGVQSSGQLVAIDTRAQAVVENYGGLGDPTTGELSPEGTSNVIDSAWRVPGTDTIYISECCEPAGGNGVYIDSETSLDDRANTFSGFAAVPSLDGSLIAVPQMVGLYVSAAAPDGHGNRVSTTPDFGAASVAWLRDRRGLVWTPLRDDVPEAIEIVILSADNQPLFTRDVPNPGLFNVTVAVRSDGALVIAGCEEFESPCEASRALVVDPDTGDVVDEFAIEAGARLGGYDPSGVFLIYTDAQQVARWQGAGQSGILAEGYYWATW